MAATEIPDDLRAVLAGRYDVSRVLGRGGMATVYLADDRKHHRQVALKVLRGDLAASLGAERFLKEIDIAARLTHPHILPLHDSGEAGGFLYYVMPYIDGGSLRSRLAPRLPLADALAIVQRVASALTYAHRMGVLHRDIKPENILFTDDHPIVADFGIAKAVSTAGGEQLTRTGFPLGTPGYMSPEQAAGLTDLDAGTDVYALACVCYEMLVGATPGRWPSEEAVRAGRLFEAPPAHRAILDSLPPHLEPALARALAIRQDQRTRTPQDLVDELGGAPRRAAAPAKAPARRQYSDDEVQAIMRRASELEVSNPTQGALTIGGIQDAAAGAGIDPALVRQAASELARPTTPLPPPARARPFSGQWWAGAPMRIIIERTVPGEVTESDCAYLVDEIRNVIGHVGIVSTLGKSVSWTASQRVAGSGMGRDVQVSITMRGGQTRIVIREGNGQLAGALFGGMGGGLGGGGLGPIIGGLAGGLHAPIAALIAAPLWVLTALSAARSFFYYRVKSRTRQLEDLADKLAAMAAALIAEGAFPADQPPPRLPR